MPTSHRAKVAHLKKSDPKLGAVIEGIRLKELAITRGYFEALVEAIVSQQLSIKAADTIFARVAALTPGKKFPTPAQILAVPSAKLRKCGLSKMKVAFIKDLARKVQNGTVDFRKMDAWSDEEVILHLTAVKGIGRWTAEMFLIFSLGREDIFSYGDLGLRNAIRAIYRMKAHPTQAQAEKLAAKWAPYRSLASRYLWASLKNEPLKRAPQK
jgi:DNA-3-methyladenine glycosylase II